MEFDDYSQQLINSYNTDVINSSSELRSLGLSKVADELDILRIKFPKDIAKPVDPISTYGLKSRLNIVHRKFRKDISRRQEEGSKILKQEANKYWKLERKFRDEGIRHCDKSIMYSNDVVTFEKEYLSAVPNSQESREIFKHGKNAATLSNKHTMLQFESNNKAETMREKALVLDRASDIWKEAASTNSQVISQDNVIEHYAVK